LDLCWNDRTAVRTGEVKESPPAAGEPKARSCSSSIAVSRYLSGASGIVTGRAAPHAPGFAARNVNLPASGKIARKGALLPQRLDGPAKPTALLMQTRISLEPAGSRTDTHTEQGARFAGRVGQT
jgi:hypothetical protein